MCFNHFFYIILLQGGFCCSTSSPWASPCMRSRSRPCPLLCHHWLGWFASTLILNNLPSTMFTDDLFCQLFGLTKFRLFTFGLSGFGSDEEHRWRQSWTLQQDHCTGNQTKQSVKKYHNKIDFLTDKYFLIWKPLGARSDPLLPWGLHGTPWHSCHCNSG